MCEGYKIESISNCYKATVGDRSRTFFFSGDEDRHSKFMEAAEWAEIELNNGDQGGSKQWLDKTT